MQTMHNQLLRIHFTSQCFLFLFLWPMATINISGCASFSPFSSNYSSLALTIPLIFVLFVSGFRFFWPFFFSFSQLSIYDCNEKYSTIIYLIKTKIKTNQFQNLFHFSSECIHFWFSLTSPICLYIVSNDINMKVAYITRHCR